MQCSVYYHSRETGEYLCQVVMAAAWLDQVKHLQESSALGDENGVGAVLVEYQDNNPELDSWIVRTAEQPESPEIFLFVAEASLQVIWKAVKLGAREIFSGTISVEDFQEALARLELRRARPGRQNSGPQIRRLAPGKEIPYPSRTCWDKVAGLPDCVPDWAAYGGS
jgi:hypothetical protein